MGRDIPGHGYRTLDNDLLTSEGNLSCIIGCTGMYIVYCETLVRSADTVYKGLTQDRVGIILCPFLEVLTLFRTHVYGRNSVYLPSMFSIVI